MFATPIPPPDCALATPSTCTMPVDTLGHGALPGNILPPRDISPCPLGGDCGPIVVTPTPTSTSSASAATCTDHHGPIPIGEECFTSGPHAGQCITFECLDFPDACGCPGAPPPPVAKMAKRTVDPAPTSTSTVTSAASTCTVHHGVIPIGEVCFTSGPQAGQCISIECRDNPNTCGCPGAPPPAPTPEKRNEQIHGDVCHSQYLYNSETLLT